MNTAMILAAGRGERLKPITEFIPKPLCKIEQIPLIEYHVRNLVKAGFKRIIINHAYLGGKIRQYLQDGKRFGVEIIYSPEPPGGLETKGGIINALPLLGQDPFLTINADIFTDYDLSKIKLNEDSLAHLVLVSKPAYLKTADFDLDVNAKICNDNRQYTFAGISCYKPELFINEKPQRSSLAPLLRELAAKKQISGEIYHGKWFDIGTHEGLQVAKASSTSNSVR